MPKPAPLPWPAHWYQGHYDIRCIVPHCEFVTDTNNLPVQYAQLRDHCTHTGGAEHALLEFMLRQNKCALCNSPPYSGLHNSTIRLLADHERRAHGSAKMFHIDSFVALARERRVHFSIGGGHLAPNADCERLTFDRMMEKAQALPFASLRLLFHKSGFHPGQYTPRSLARILTHDPSTPPHDNSPLPPDRFLWFCRPRGDDPADPDNDWIRVWRELREAYTDGRL